MKAPLRPGTRPVGAAQLAVEGYYTYSRTLHSVTHTHRLLTYLLTYCPNVQRSAASRVPQPLSLSARSSKESAAPSSKWL